MILAMTMDSWISIPVTYNDSSSTLQLIQITNDVYVPQISTNKKFIFLLFKIKSYFTVQTITNCTNIQFHTFFPLQSLGMCFDL